MPSGKSPKKTSLLDKKQLTCKPLDTYNEILNFLEDPPPWRALCKEYTPHSHSQYKMKNMELNPHYSSLLLETPDVFCHYNPSAEEPKRYHEENLPKTLVCHDMANGYHDDSFIDGTGNYDAYTFYNWAGIDIFCYFSHHLITIPPLGWINVGHAHGVKVIGTVITEWAEGIVFWDKILDSETEYQNFASALVAIATTLKFDGWLLNVENKIAKPAMLLDFVKHLHRILHQAIPHAVLIWYDSVTIQGKLNWQNGLTEKNRAFFNACDGLFTNYSWTVQDVQKSAEYAAERVFDLYVGIDVWGRNFYGGGEFNTMEAVKVAYEAGCSLAIFAPAWTHEGISDSNTDSQAIISHSDNMDKLQKFLIRDRALWGSLWPFLSTRVPCSLPFQTSFCKGQGRQRRMYGEVLSPLPWYNLRHQHYQPNSAHGPHGYILSTMDNILSVSRQGVTRRGILRFRDSFLATPRVSLQRVESSASLSETTTSGTATSSYLDSITGIVPENQVQVENRNEPKRTSSERSQIPTAEMNQQPPIAERPESERPESGCPRGLKRKVQTAFRNLFKLKSARSEPALATHHDVATPDTEPTTSRTAHARFSSATAVSDPRPDDDEAGEEGRGPCSMMKMSVTLSLGQVHRPRIALAVVPHEAECLQTYSEDSFTGGSCLLVSPSDTVNVEHRNSRLLWCEWAVPHSALAVVVTKHVAGWPQQALNLKLYMRNALGQDLRVVMVGRTITGLDKLETDNPSGLINVYPLSPGSERFRQMQCHLLLNEPGFYVPVENSFGWHVRYYEVRAPGSQVRSVNCKTDHAQGPIMLGHFGLCLWDDAAQTKQNLVQDDATQTKQNIENNN